MKDHTYIPVSAKVLEKKELTPETVSLTIKLRSKLSYHPGQFVMLGVLGWGEVPIGITNAPSSGSELELAVRSAGMVTSKLCGLKKNDEVYINGPFGNGFPLSKIKGRDVVLVAGGIGLAPLRSLIEYIKKNKKFVRSLTILIGAKSPEFLMYRDEYKEWEKFAKVETTVDACDKSWDGCTGLITKLFDKTEIKPGSVMISCGPPVMYKSIIKYYAGKRVSEDDLYFLLERRMKCGVGKCQHCTCGELYVCTDGPLFSYSQIKYNKEAALS